MNKEQLQRIFFLALLKDRFKLDSEEALSMYFSNDLRDISKSIYGEVD